MRTTEQRNKKSVSILFTFVRRGGGLGGRDMLTLHSIPLPQIFSFCFEHLQYMLQ